MAKKPAPIIAHVEILCMAIRYIESEIKNQTTYMEGIPGCEAYLKNFISERAAKLEALKTMYHFETGTDYE